MTISKKALAELELVKTVNEAIDDFLQDWRIAAIAAITNWPAPEDGDAKRQWWIAFGGNMLWAWVVFCPVSAAGAGLAAAAGSLFGAALAGGVASRLASKPQVLATPAGKAMVTQDLFEQAEVANWAFKQISPAWSTDVLLPAIFAELRRQLEASSVQYSVRREAYRRRHPNAKLAPDFFLEDNELSNWFNGNDQRKGDEWVKSFIWNNLMFLRGSVKYEFRNAGLLKYFTTLIKLLEEQFEAQREIYEYNWRVKYDEYRKSTSSSPGLKSNEEYWREERVFDKDKAAHPFIFKPFYGVAPKGDIMSMVLSQYKIIIP